MFEEIIEVYCAIMIFAFLIYVVIVFLRRWDDD